MDINELFRLVSRRADNQIVLRDCILTRKKVVLFYSQTFTWIVKLYLRAWVMGVFSQ